MKFRIVLLTVLLTAFTFNIVLAQENEKDKGKKDRHTFTMIYFLNATSVKNQAKTGTCWDFATQSFLESELLRMGKGQHDLSEMFDLQYTYPLKAERYVRYHGKSQFGEGGKANDVLKVFDTYAAVPEGIHSKKIYSKPWN